MQRDTLENVYENAQVVLVRKTDAGICMTPAETRIISEVYLKLYVNGDELASLICLNRQHVPLALGLLYSEGVIDSREDVLDAEFIEPMMAVNITLREGLVHDRRESLRSLTAGCGKCYTYINPLKRNQYSPVPKGGIHSAAEILGRLDAFMSQSRLYNQVGGTHSVQLCAGDYELLTDDIGRHNCLDKITGILLQEGKLDLARDGVLYVSGRLTSEMLMKMIRLGIPVAVSKSSPTTAAIRLAEEYDVTIMGYVTGGGGAIYSHPERITP